MRAFALLAALIVVGCSDEDAGGPGTGGAGAAGTGGAGAAGGVGASGGGGCVPDGDAQFCASLGKNCGAVSGTDNCGASRTDVDCGSSCPTPQTCGGGGEDNVCGGGTGGTYTLPADRATAWNPGVTYGGGGIPVRTTVCATLSPSGGDDTAAIQGAIDACPEGEVVALSAGTFTCGDLLLIDKGITLRGAGAGLTTIEKPNGAVFGTYQSDDTQPNLIIGPNRWPWADDASSQNLTADGAKGDTSVTVADAAGFAPGQFILLDELSNASFRTDPLGRGEIYASEDMRTVWWYHNPAGPSDDPVGDGAEQWFSRPYRVTTEVKEIADVSGNTITFTTPLHIDYRVANEAQVTGYGSNQHVTGAGVEGITFVGGSDGAVRFETAAYSWARNIEAHTWLGGVIFQNSFRCELRDSWIHDAAWPVPGGAGYAIDFSSGSAEILVENNISMLANKVMVARAAGAGSVVGYNYMDAGIIGTEGNAGWIEVGINGSHMVGPHHILFEGNLSFNFDSDRTHGNSIYHTVFRNWLTAYRAPHENALAGVSQDDLVGDAGPLRCIGANAYSYWMSFVGNVLGTPGEMGAFVDEVQGDWFSSAGIWLLGWDAEEPYPYDAEVAATAIRDGNYDYLNNEQRWLTSEEESLPYSLYLASKPDFFGSNPWPWVDPTTGTTFTLPAKARFDSGTPNVLP